MTSRILTIALILLAPLAWSAASRPGTAQADPGQAIYAQRCAQCHGPRGVPASSMRSVYPTIPTFNAAFLAARTPDSIVKVLSHGKKDMPSFKGVLTAPEMMSVATYVHGLGAH